MKIQLHDAYYTFDYTMAVNAIFDKLVEEHGEIAAIASHLGMSYRVIYKFFDYQSVSMPTFLALASAAQINLMDFVIKQD